MVILVYIVFIFAISFLSVLEVFLSFGHARRVSAMSGAFFQKVEIVRCCCPGRGVRETVATQVHHVLKGGGIMPPVIVSIKEYPLYLCQLD